MGTEIGIVIGGGNMLEVFKQGGMERTQGDYMVC